MLDEKTKFDECPHCKSTDIMYCGPLQWSEKGVVEQQYCRGCDESHFRIYKYDRSEKA